jgi:osmotically-inducible protein OsmY
MEVNTMITTHAGIKERIAEALLEDPRTRDYGIEVIDDRGVVTLGGNVASEEVRQAAEMIVRQLPGVISVINTLRIRS